MLHRIMDRLNPPTHWFAPCVNTSATDIDASVHDPNQRNYINIRNSIMQVTNGTLPANYRASYLGNSSIPSSPSYNQAGLSSPYINGTGTTPNGLGHNGSGARPVFSHQGLQFKPSPFYEIETPLGDVRQCEGRLTNTWRDENGREESSY